MPLSSFRDVAPPAADLLLNGGREMFSGVTVFRGNELTAVFNDAHVPGRRAGDIGHGFPMDCCFIRPRLP